MRSFPPIVLIIIIATLVWVAASYFLARVISKRRRNVPQIRVFTIVLIVGLAILFFILLFYVSSLFENG